MRGCSFAGLTPALLLLSACGSENPAAPTMVDPPPPPIVVTLTAQVVSNQAVSGVMQGVRTVVDRGFVERRNVRVIGNVDVTGGNATVEATVTLTHTIGGANPPSPIVSRIFDSRLIMPAVGGIDFTTDIPFTLPPGASGSTFVTVDVTGLDTPAGRVDVSRDLAFDPELSLKPAGTCIDTDTVPAEAGLWSLWAA